jgi:hypothetical protein
METPRVVAMSIKLGGGVVKWRTRRAELMYK